MAIEYIEVRRKYNREIMGIIDGAKSVIWHSEYFGVGDFEIYALASAQNLQLLVEGNYISRPNDINIGVIENVEVVNNTIDGKMIVASGRFAKSILDRRHIYQLTGTVNTPTTLRGNVETNVRNLVKNNAINCPFDSRRNISFLELGASAGIPAIIVDSDGNATQKQVSYENLLDYSDSVLAEYDLSSRIILDDNGTRKFQYVCFKGIDRSVDNTDGNDPVIFSTEFDNLAESTYLYNSQNKKTAALIGGEGEGLERFYSVIDGSESGLERREMWVDASSIARTLDEDSLRELFPTGVFSGVYFRVSGTVYAKMVILDEARDTTLSALQSMFPSGSVSGTNFVVGGTTYATKVYATTDEYRLTDEGYVATSQAEGSKEDYQLTVNVYKTMLDAQGKQELSEMRIVESFDGVLNVTGGVWRLGEHYNIGDIVTVQDKEIGKYANVRITEITEVQDENGYSVTVTYQS